MSLYLWVAYVTAFLVFLPLTALSYLAGYKKDPFREWPNRFFMAAGSSFYRLNPFWKHQVLGLEKVDLSRPVIFAGNHQSFLDMPLIATLPWKMKWVSKQELMRLPVAGWMMAMSGHISVERGKKDAFQSLYKLQPYLENSIPVMIYPEGTRSRDGKLRRFKNGAFIISREYNYPVQPVVVEGTYNLLPPDRWRVRWRGRIYISILDPIHPSDFSSMEEFRDYTYEVFKNEINRLKKLGQQPPT